MRKHCFLYVMLVTLCLSLAWPSAYGYCSETSGQEPNQITVSMNDWKILQENNKKQEIALQKSAEALMTARQALNESTTALQTTRNELEQSRTELQTLRQALTASQKETAELLTNLQMQKSETQRLRQQLTTLQEQSATAANSIEAAQKYLDDTRTEILQNEKAHEKTEKALKNKITAWQIVAAILGGVAITR